MFRRVLLGLFRRVLLGLLYGVLGLFCRVLGLFRRVLGLFRRDVFPLRLFGLIIGLLRFRFVFFGFFDGFQSGGAFLVFPLFGVLRPLKPFFFVNQPLHAVFGVVAQAFFQQVAFARMTDFHIHFIFQGFGIEITHFVRLLHQ